MHKQSGTRINERMQSFLPLFYSSVHLHAWVPPQESSEAGKQEQHTNTPPDLQTDCQTHVQLSFQSPCPRAANLKLMRH